MFILLLFFTVILVICYIKFKYFSLRRSIPGLSPHLFFGNLIQTGVLIKNIPLSHVFLAFKVRYGDVYQFWLGPTRYIVVNNANDVQHIFTHRYIYDLADFFVDKLGILFSDTINSTIGLKYKRHAAVIIPVFRHGKISSNLDVIVNCTDKLLAKWHGSPNGKVHVDIVEQCKNFLLTLLGLIAFDYDLETLNNDNKKGDNEFTQALKYILGLLTPVMYLPTFIASAYIKFNYRHKRAKKIIQHYFDQMIKKEQSHNKDFREQRKRTSLIASLVSSLQEDEQIEAHKNEEEKKGISREELLNEMLLLLVSSYETTSTTLSWLIHLISKYPRVQQKIKEELKNNGASQDLSLEHLDSMTYLDCVLMEVLRFSPAIPGIMRTMINDDHLPESGVDLRKGDHILIPLYNLTRDNRYWSIDPELFYPERFLNEDKNHHPYAFIPFGGGHRQCVGKTLSQFLLKVVLARLMQRVTLGDAGPEINAGGHFLLLTTRPKHVGITINFD